MHILISCLMKNKNFVFIYFKYIKTCINMYKVYIWFMIEFSKDIFEIFYYIIVLNICEIDNLIVWSIIWFYMSIFFKTFVFGDWNFFNYIK